MSLSALLLLLCQSPETQQALAEAERLAQAGQFEQAVAALADAGDGALVLTARGTYMLRAAEAAAAAGSLSGDKLVMAFMDAAGVLEQATKDKDAPAAAFTMWSEAFLNVEDYGEAQKAIKAGRRKHKDDLDLMLQEGRVLAATAKAIGEGSRKDRMLKSAAAAYERAVKEHPDSATACVRLGEVQVLMEQFEDAKQSWTDALARDASAVDLNAMGQWLQEEAIPVLAGHIEARGDDATSLWYLGLFEYNAKPRQWAGAKTHFLRAMDLNPQFANTWYFLGEGSMAEGQRLQALATEAEGKEDADPSAEELHRMARQEYLFSAKAWANYLDGFGANQRAGLQQAEDKGDGFVASMKWLSGQAIGARDLQSAVKLARWVVETRPRDAEAWNNYAFLLRDSNRPAESLQAYEQANQLRPNDPGIMNDLAVILHYYLKKDDERARSLYERAIKRAEEILADPQGRSEAEVQVVRIALRDARNNLAKLEAGDRNPLSRPRGAGAGNDPGDAGRPEGTGG